MGGETPGSEAVGVSGLWPPTQAQVNLQPFLGRWAAGAWPKGAGLPAGFDSALGQGFRTGPMQGLGPFPGGVEAGQLGFDR